ncbi:hypothetical protein Mal48_35510 [Thalassoglobus polymorphus]|uniref:Uncharacterized protein n=1 Tax=Thalassoglobus polymorphus TaxID=2527994 RepID=A0A517QRP9_9PLAN|nr:hypothetical protein Mal48_35510 [Thalassoglobus polymorphus]
MRNSHEVNSSHSYKSVRLDIAATPKRADNEVMQSVANRLDKH